MEIDGIVGLLLLGVWLFAIFDVISTENSSVRNLPKPLWLLLVVLLPDVGAIAWLFLGRPLKPGARPSETPVRRPRVRPRPTAREEEAEFIARIEARDRMLAQWAEEDRRKASDPTAERPPASTPPPASVPPPAGASPVSESPVSATPPSNPLPLPSQDEIDERVRQLEADLARDDPDLPS